MGKRKSKAELIEGLKQLDKEVDSSPTTTEMDNKGPHSSAIYYKRFDSWNDALRKAGIEVEHERTSHADKEWTNKENLRKLYWDEGMSTYEIGDKVGVRGPVVHQWMQKQGVETRSDIGRPRSKAKHHDKEWLKKKYHGEGLSIGQIADLIGIDDSVISRAMTKHGIEFRDKLNHKNHPPNLNTNERGYEYFKNYHNGESNTFQHHQLVTIAEGADPHNVFDRNTVVHHKNKITWDNRPENLRVMSISDHIKLHIELGDW